MEEKGGIGSCAVIGYGMRNPAFVHRWWQMGENKKPGFRPGFCLKEGASQEIWTLDLLITSELLYRWANEAWKETTSRLEKQPLCKSSFVGMTRFELATSTSRTLHATNCATSRLVFGSKSTSSFRFVCIWQAKSVLYRAAKIPIFCEKRNFEHGFGFRDGLVYWYWEWEKWLVMQECAGKRLSLPPQTRRPAGVGRFAKVEGFGCLLPLWKLFEIFPNPVIGWFLTGFGIRTAFLKKAKMHVGKTGGPSPVFGTPAFRERKAVRPLKSWKRQFLLCVPALYFGVFSLHLSLFAKFVCFPCRRCKQAIIGHSLLSCSWFG